MHIRLALMWILWTVCRSFAGDVVSEPLGRNIDDAIRRSSLGQFWGAVGVVKDGGVVLAKGYGLANEQLTPIDADSLFDIGSVTKQFTAAAILRLEMDGKLSTDDRVAMWVDDVPRENQTITIYHLLTHTSGLSQGDMEFPGKDDGSAVATAAMSVTAKAPPGVRWEYSNAGYFVLAAIIERASGETYATYLQQHVFTPAGMRHTAVQGSANLESGHSTLRVNSQGKTCGDACGWPYPMIWGYQGAGGVVSSVTDMLQWDAALRGRDVLSDAAKVKLFSAFKHGYACGWEAAASAQGRMVSHSGGVAGFATWYTRWLDHHTAMIVMTNERNNPHDIETLIRRTLFPQSGPAPGVELRLEGLQLNENKGVELVQGLSVSATREGDSVQIQVVTAGDARPAAILTLNRDDAARVESEIQNAMQTAHPGDAQAACGVYLRPYQAVEGKVSIRGDDVQILVLPGVNESGSNGSHFDPRITLVVQDERRSFWPLMLRMNESMAGSLRKAIGAAALPEQAPSEEDAGSH